VGPVQGARRVFAALEGADECAVVGEAVSGVGGIGGRQLRQVDGEKIGDGSGALEHVRVLRVFAGLSVVDFIRDRDFASFRF